MQPLVTDYAPTVPAPYTVILRKPSVPPRTRRPVTAHLPMPLSHRPILSAMNLSCFWCSPATHLWMHV